MPLRSLFYRIFPRFNPETKQMELHEEMCNLEIETYIKSLAIETAVNLISSTLGLAEFKTFDEGKEIRKDNYYLFNVEPNVNQNASRFWRKVIHNLVKTNDALVIMQDDGLFVADSFTKEPFAFKENIYKNLQIENYQVRRIFNESEVFYFALHSTEMKKLIDGLYRDYGILIEYSKKHYRTSNARRGILDIPTNYPQTEEYQNQLKKLLDVNMKTFFETEKGSVLPLTGGLKYTDLTNASYKNGSDSRDIRSLIDDVFDYVAIAFQIPPQMLKGNLADSDNSWNSYLTHCIKPLAELLEKEINRKYFGKKAYLEKTMLKVDTSLIKAVDIKDLASAIDVLTRNGVNTLDDNLRMLGREEVGGELGQKRFMTLNLEDIENAKERGRKED